MYNGILFPLITYDRHPRRCNSASTSGSHVSLDLRMAASPADLHKPTARVLAHEPALFERLLGVHQPLLWVWLRLVALLTPYMWPLDSILTCRLSSVLTPWHRHGRVWDAKTGQAACSLHLQHDPQTLAWHPGGAALVVTNAQHVEQDRLVCIGFQASPAKLRVSREARTEDEVGGPLGGMVVGVHCLPLRIDEEDSLTGRRAAAAEQNKHTPSSPCMSMRVPCGNRSRPCLCQPG